MKSFNIGVRINLNKVMNDIIQKIQEKIKLIKGSKPSKEEIIKDLMLTGMYLHELEESNRLDSAFNGLVKEGDVQLIEDSVQIPEAIVQIQLLIQDLKYEIDEKDSQIESLETELESLKQNNSIKEQGSFNKERELLEYKSKLNAEKEELFTKLIRLDNLEEQVNNLKSENRQLVKEKAQIEKDFRKALLKGKDRDWFDYLAPFLPTIATIISTVIIGKKLDNNSNLNNEFEKLINGFEKLPAEKKKIIKAFVNAHGAKNTNNRK
jgi:chromosome segregation ATPase